MDPSSLDLRFISLSIDHIMVPLDANGCCIPIFNNL